MRVCEVFKKPRQRRHKINANQRNTLTRANNLFSPGGRRKQLSEEILSKKLVLSSVILDKYLISIKNL